MRILIAILALFAIACEGRIITAPSPTPAAVAPPLIITFTADATRLGSASLDTYLRWDVDGTTDTRCRIDSFAAPSQTIGNVPLGGFVQVRPQISRDYALACTNAGGTVIRYVSIFVG